MSADRYIRFKITAPSTVTDKKAIEAYKKLEYMGPVENGKIKKMYLRQSVKQPWKRYMETNEFLTNRDEHPEELSANIGDVIILEDMDKLTYLKKYFTKLFI